nr:hypothetical protein [Microbispora rosea]
MSRIESRQNASASAGQFLTAAAARVERLQRGHALQSVEVLGVQALVALEPGGVSVFQHTVRHQRKHWYQDRAQQHDDADDRVEREQERGHSDRTNQGGDRLRQELADIGVYGLDPVDQRGLRRAGPAALCPARPQQKKLGGQAAPQLGLDGARRPQTGWRARRRPSARPPPKGRSCSTC